MSHEIQRLSALSLTRQQSTGGYAYGRGTTYPSTFEATDSGHASGYTTVSSTLGAYGSANDDFVGMLIEAVDVAAGPAEGGAPLRRKVLAYDHATTTLTHEAFPFQTVDGDSFRLLDDPGVVFAEKNGGSQTAVVDADVSMTADAINGDAAMGGPYMAALKTDNLAAGLQRRVTDYAASTATVTSLGASTVIGDLFEAHQWLEVFGDSLLKLTPGRVARESMVGSHGRLRGVHGSLEAAGAVELAFRGPGASRIGEPAEADMLISSVMTPADAPADETVGAGSTTTAIEIASAGTAGELWCTESGDACVDTTGADPLVPSPSLRIAPAAGETLYGLRRYTLADAARYCLKAVQWRGKGLKEEIVGILPKLKYAGERGGFFKLQFELTGADGYSVYLDETASEIARPSALNPKLSTVVPRAQDTIRVNIDGTEFKARSVSGDLGFQVEKEINLAAPNQVTTAYRGDAIAGEVALYLDTDEKALAVKAWEGKAMRFLLQVGTVPGYPGVFMLWLNEIEVDSIDFGESEGMVGATIQYHATYDTTSDLERAYIGIG